VRSPQSYFRRTPSKTELRTEDLNLPAETSVRLPLEIARTRAVHRIHEAAEILADAMPSVAVADRQLYAAIVGGLWTLERHLTDIGRSGSPVNKEGV
jgi:hypothetical protein